MQIMQITQDTSSVARRFPSAYWHDAIAENAPAVPAYADATGFFWQKRTFRGSRKVRNLRADGSPQEQLAWGELEGEFYVGIAWGNQAIFPISDFLIFRKPWGL